MIELLAAALTAVTAAVVLGQLMAWRRAGACARAGPLLWQARPWLRRWQVALLALLACVTLGWLGALVWRASKMLPLAGSSWPSDPVEYFPLTPGLVFFVSLPASAALAVGWVWAGRRLEVGRRGIVLGRFVPWRRVRRCRFVPSRGIVRVHLSRFRRTAWPCSAAEWDGLASLVSPYVELCDASGTVLNPDRDPAVVQALTVEEPPRGRLQFSLRGLLVFTVFVAAASAWLGIHLRAKWKEEAALAALDEYWARVEIKEGRAWCIEFSAPTNRPGDAQMALVADCLWLRTLNLAGCPIGDAGCEPLGSLTHLTGLRLYDTRITDAGLVYVGRLRSLEWLDLEETRITGAGLAHLADLDRLEFLDLDGTRVSDAGLAELKRLRSLHSLSLADTAITDAGLAQLADYSGLRSLDLRGTRLTDAGLAQLRNLTRLGTLSLPQTAITDAGLAHLARLDDLEVLNLADTRVGDAGLGHLVELDSLGSLDLRNTLVTDAGLAQLGQCRKLHTLNLTNTPVTDAGLVHLARLNLSRLYLAGTQVTDAGVAHLAQCKDLVGLDAQNTRVTLAGVARLAELPWLRFVCLDNVNITPEDLTRVQKQMPNTQILLETPQGKRPTQP